MIITEKKTENGKDMEVIFFEKRKYKRIIINGQPEWRRYKTNHQVPQAQHVYLEKTYEIEFPPSGNLNVINDTHRRMLERELVDVSNNGRMLLAGVKHVKERTGWGLKESKEFVDEFFARKKAYNS